MAICPKKAVTALNASEPGNILSVSTGTPRDDVLTQLLGRKDDQTTRAA